MDELLLIVLRGGKFILASGLLTLLYLWLFRGKASYNSCRLFLLSIPLLAVLVSQFNLRWNVSLPDYIQTTSLVPLRSVPEVERVKKQEALSTKTIVVSSEQTITSTEVENPNRAKHLFLALYGAIALLLILAFFRQVNKVLRIRRDGMRKSASEYEVVVHPEVPTPFSFYKTIFLNEALTGSKLDLVLKHECYHIVHKHYVDVFLVQLLVRLAWFNPVHWWIRKELLSLNEYQTDQSVLSEGQDIYQYQTVILEEVMATNPFLASGLNDSFTKRRFVMMKKQPSLQLKALRRLLPVPVLLGLFVVFSLDIQATTDPDKMTPVALNLSYLNKVDSNWDEQSGVCVLSKSLDRAFANNETNATYSQAYFSYRLNEDTLVGKPMVENDLNALSDLLKLVVKKGEALVATSTVSSAAGKNASYSSLTTLINFLQYNIDDRALETLECLMSTALSMNEAARTEALKELEALGLLAQKTATSMLDANDKLLKFKYLAYRTTANTLVWEYLEPQMVQLALDGQTTQKKIVFLRLGRGRLRNQQNDARIWIQAPRFSPAQVSVCRNDAGYTDNGISSIRRTRKDTRVTLHYLVGGNEWWFYFDKGLSLIDRATGDIYLIKKMDRNIPLNKTLVVTGCCKRYVEFTLIFPPLPESVTTVDLREFIADRSNIMSDNSGETRYENLSLNEYALK